MRGRRDIAVGQLFREVGRDSFGRPRGTIWQVQAVLGGAEDAGEPRHIRVVDSADPERLKTLSVDVLLDRQAYVRVEVPLETPEG